MNKKYLGYNLHIKIKNGTQFASHIYLPLVR
jgi:hypothetical protein